MPKLAARRDCDMWGGAAGAAVPLDGGLGLCSSIGMTVEFDFDGSDYAGIGGGQ